MDHDLEVVEEGFTFLESPRWWDGDLYASDFYSHRVVLFPGGRAPARTVVEVPEQPSGLVRNPQGQLMAVSMLDRTLLCWDGSRLTKVADLTSLVTGPANDAASDGRGRTWVGNFGDDDGGEGGFSPTTIVTISPDGATRVAATGLNFPNGMVVAEEGRTLLVAETFAARITAFTIQPDGTLTDRRTWADLGIGDIWDVPTATAAQPLLPDGIALDADGALWVADAKGARGALRIAEGGEVLDQVDTGALAAYAVALGGPDGRELYLCCAAPLGTEDPARTRNAALLRTTVAVPGRAS